jgi:hypothetical protein
VDPARIEHLKMIQAVISRLATCSFQLKGWVITLAAALQVFLKGEAHPVYLFVPALPVLLLVAGRLVPSPGAPVPAPLR